MQFIYFLNIFILFICISFPSQSTAIISNLPVENAYFTGRKDYLKTISDTLKSDNKSVVVLVGLGGIGKSQIAKKYAIDNSGKYDIIWWIDASKNIPQQVQRLGEEWSNISKTNIINPFETSEEITTKEILKKLATSKKSWLIIFDNALNYASIKQYIPKVNEVARKHVLVTSRNTVGWPRIVKVNVFSKEESFELINKVNADLNLEAVLELSNLTGNYPLALVQASAFLKANPGVSIEDYIKLFQKNKIQLWKYEQKILQNPNYKKVQQNILDSYKFTFEKALAINLKQLKRQSQASYQLLLLSAYLDKGNISASILKKYLDNDYIGYNEAMQLLLNFSLLNIKESRMSTEHVFEMDEIIQEVIKNSLPAKERQEILKKAIKTLIDLLPHEINRLVKLLTKDPSFLSNIEILLDQATKLEIFDDETLTLKIRYLEYYLTSKRDFDKSKKIIAEIESLINKLEEISILNKVRFLIMKSAYLSWSKEDNKGGIEVILEAKKLLKDIHDAKEEKLMIINRLVQNYHFLGNIEEAMKYVREGDILISSTQGYLGNKGTFYGAKARLMLEDENYKEAIKAIDLAKSELKSLELDDKNIIGFVPVFSLEAGILLKSGQNELAYNKALSLYQVLKKQLGLQPHYFLGSTLIILGNAALKLAKLDLADKYAKEALEVLYKVYKDDKSRHIAYAHTLMGDILVENRNYKLAQLEYTKAEQIYNFILSNKSLKVLGSLYASMAINEACLKDSFATKHYLDLLKNKFGNGHKDTLKVIDYLVENNLQVP